MATDEEILKVFTMCKVNYKYALKDYTPQEISDLQVVWCELLKDIDGGLLKLATIQYIASPKAWFPKIGELRAIAADIANPDHRMTATEAWGEVVRQIRAVGSYDRPQFSNLLIERMVFDMGWRNLCFSDMPGADRARFIDGYNALLKREKREAVELPQVTAAKQQFKRLAEQKRIDAPDSNGGMNDEYT